MGETKLTKIGKEIATELKNIKEIEAIAFYGSLASGFADKYSDIDIICVCNKMIPTKTRSRILNELKIKNLKNKIIGEIGQDTFNYEGKNVGIVYLTKNHIENWLDSVKKRGRLDREDSLMYAEIYSTKEIFDKNNLFVKYRKEVRRYIKKDMLKWFWPALHDFIKYEGGLKEAKLRKNKIWIYGRMTINLRWFFDCLYIVNNEYYHDGRLKWAFKEIETFRYKPRNCINRLEKIMVLGNEGKELNQKIRIFKQLIKDLEPFIPKKYR